MKKIIYFLAITILLGACSKAEEGDLNSHIATISTLELKGEWQLIKIVNTFSTKTTHYANENITFTFKSNGKVIISNDNNAFSKGEYNYEIKSESITANQENEILMLIIGGVKFTYTYKNEIMILSNAYVDGPVLHLKKNI